MKPNTLEHDLRTWKCKFVSEVLGLIPVLSFKRPLQSLQLVEQAGQRTPMQGKDLR